MIIKLEKISKIYKKSKYNAIRYLSLREDILSIINKKDKNDEAGSTGNEFYALREIDLTIKSGEKVGIIGRNGAGKSTLLKVLSKVTYPTSGSIQVNGRISSLLEVGSGFHPELTGYENIYLSGAILGMKKKEIDSCIADIVDFSEIGDFLHMPVKHYSSGMYSRLAFSISTHVSAEIIIVDEVLAVGDSRFQEKSIKKMNDLTRGGKTLLFVSHNMQAVTGICTRAIVLDSGSIIYDGDVKSAISVYSNSNNNTYAQNLPTDERVKISEILVSNSDANDASGEAFDLNDQITIRCNYEALVQLADFEITCIIRRDGYDVCTTKAYDNEDSPWRTLSIGAHVFVLKIEPTFLKAGSYEAIFVFGDAHENFFDFPVYFKIEENELVVKNRGFYSKRPGVVFFKGAWSHYDL